MIGKLVLFALFLFMTIGYLAVKAETKVETSVETISLPDKDGDGLLDENDPHPDYPEIYIVKDDNRNGIVDQFEQK